MGGTPPPGVYWVFFLNYTIKHNNTYDEPTQHRRKLEEELDRLNTVLSAEYAVIQDNVKRELLRYGWVGN